MSIIFLICLFLCKNYLNIKIHNFEAKNKK
jgi:hypothetical protein